MLVISTGSKLKHSHKGFKEIVDIPQGKVALVSDSFKWKYGCNASYIMPLEGKYLYEN